MKKFITFFILLFTILVGTLFAQSSPGLSIRRLDRTMLDQHVSGTTISRLHSKIFSFDAVDVAVEDSNASNNTTLKDGVIQFLSLAFTFGLVVFTNHDWSNRFMMLNKAIAEKMRPKYLLFHNLKLYF